MVQKVDTSLDLLPPRQSVRIELESRSIGIILTQIHGGWITVFLLFRENVILFVYPRFESRVDSHDHANGRLRPFFREEIKAYTPEEGGEGGREGGRTGRKQGRKKGRKQVREKKKSKPCVDHSLPCDPGWFAHTVHLEYYSGCICWSSAVPGRWKGVLV